MNYLFTISLLTIMSLTACSKKSDNSAQGNSKTITIDGTTYNTVIIGSQTWTAVNYNGPGGVNYSGSTTNDPAYGKLYTVAEAQAIALPKGWHLPTEDDYSTLSISIGGPSLNTNGTYLASDLTQKLMSASYWVLAGTNSSGFNAVPTGYYGRGLSPGSYYYGIGVQTVFVTSSNYPGTMLPANLFISSGPAPTASAYFGNGIVTANDRGSVRFVKNN